MSPEVAPMDLPTPPTVEPPDGALAPTEGAERGPLVSVVTATYNDLSALRGTLESVAAQSHRSREHIVVDGASTDGTPELLSLPSTPVDRWISEPDRGIYEALNKGIELARGDWLYFLGAGDRLVDEQVLGDLLAEEPTADLVYGDVLWGDTGRRYGGRFSKLKLVRQNICHQAIFYRRDLFDRLGSFELDYPLCADWAFNLRCFGAAEVKTQYVDRVIARFEQTGASASQTDEQFLRDRAQLIGRLGKPYAWLYRLYKALRGPQVNARRPPR